EPLAWRMNVRRIPSAPPKRPASKTTLSRGDAWPDSAASVVVQSSWANTNAAKSTSWESSTSRSSVCRPGLNVVVQGSTSATSASPRVIAWISLACLPDDPRKMRGLFMRGFTVRSGDEGQRTVPYRRNNPRGGSREAGVVGLGAPARRRLPRALARRPRRPDGRVVPDRRGAVVPRRPAARVDSRLARPGRDDDSIRSLRPDRGRASRHPRSQARADRGAGDGGRARRVAGRADLRRPRDAGAAARARL